MLTRIVVGVVGAAAYIYINFATNGLPFALGVALFSMIGALELYRAVKSQGVSPASFSAAWPASCSNMPPGRTTAKSLRRTCLPC